jgi:hypothetical protein
VTGEYHAGISRTAGDGNGVLMTESHVTGLERYVTFHKFIGRLLAAAYPDSAIISSGRMIRRMEVDYVIEQHGQAPIVLEVKSSAPMTMSRIRDVIRRLAATKEAWNEQEGVEPSVILVVPELLSPERRTFLAENQVGLWDSEWIFEQSIRFGLLEEARPYVGDHAEDFTQKAGRQLIDELQALAPGRDNWSAYQDLCTRILQFLFCPPLESPITERSNLPKVNRRDIILPNYSIDGLFGFLHSRYGAEFIVADAKNYKELAKKNEVLQMANYLSGHGSGLFGLILTRKGVARGGEQTIREQWMIHQKMIIILNDDDLVQMITLKEGGMDAGVVIRQKIEDFRLSF